MNHHMNHAVSMDLIYRRFLTGDEIDQLDDKKTDDDEETIAQRLDGLVLQRILATVMPGVSLEQLVCIPRPLLFHLIRFCTDRQLGQIVDLLKHPAMELRGRMHVGSAVVYSAHQRSAYLFALSMLLQVGLITSKLAHSRFYYSLLSFHRDIVRMPCL